MWNVGTVREAQNRWKPQLANQAKPSLLAEIWRSFVSSAQRSSSMCRYSVSLCLTGSISTYETFINNVQRALSDVADQAVLSVLGKRCWLVCRIFVQQLAWLTGVSPSLRGLTRADKTGHKWTSSSITSWTADTGNERETLFKHYCCYGVSINDDDDDDSDYYTRCFEWHPSGHSVRQYPYTMLKTRILRVSSKFKFALAYCRIYL